MSEHPFNLSLEDYWSDPWKTLEDIAWDIVQEKRAGILLDVPEHVAIGERETAPALVYYSDFDNRLAATPFRGRAVVTTVQLQTKVVRAGLALPPRPGSPARGTPSSGSSGKERPGFSGMEFNIDLYKTGTVREADPGPYLVTILLQDQTSNRVQMHLGERPPSYDDPEVKKYLEAEWAKRPSRKVSPAVLDHPVVRYVHLENPLPVPGEIGMTLDADRVVVNRAGERGRLRISFRLPVERADVLEAGPRLTSSEEREAGEEPDLVSPPVRAVVPISLVLTGSERASPLVWSFNVPSFAAVEERGGQVLATGQFEVDLLQDAIVRAQPQTFFIYAFSGEQMAGPVLVGVVDEQQLPPNE